MTSNIKVRLQLILVAFFISCPSLSMSNPSKTQEGLTPKVAADYIHSVIEANRTIYSQYIVERLGETISLKATENWEEAKTLLLPAQFLLTSSKINNSRGKGMQYRLMSLWPINKKNAPKNSRERKGLMAVAENPKTTFTWETRQQGQLYFNAVYPDIAVSKSCASCHNNHPSSLKTDYKKGDVMGGIMITIPLGKDQVSQPIEKIFLPPKTVADYVHSILEADRTVYAKYIVNRLQQENIIYASENWWEENTLLLPAQFLLNSSDVIKNSPIKLKFRLISLWPINNINGAADDFEKEGLESVVKNPGKPFSQINQIENKKIFQAIYPDFAVTPACVSCHNNHPRSPKNNFKLNDVIGGLVVSFPVN